MNGVDHERNRHFAAHVTQSLREDYRLRADETERAVGLYMRRKAGWATPDQAAFEAYRWWAATVDPSVVITREAEQLAHAHRADDSDTHPDRSQPVARDRNDKDADQARTEVVQHDLAAIEPAPAMSRDHGERNEFPRHRPNSHASSDWSSTNPRKGLDHARRPCLGPHTGSGRPRGGPAARHRPGARPRGRHGRHRSRLRRHHHHRAARARRNRPVQLHVHVRIPRRTGRAAIARCHQDRDGRRRRSNPGPRPRRRLRAPRQPGPQPSHRAGQRRRRIPPGVAGPAGPPARGGSDSTRRRSRLESGTRAEPLGSAR